jgi:sodium/potassium/calcium exchanger 6
MAIVNPFKVSRKSFLRDAIFFAGAVAFSVGLLADGKITTWETSAMIAYYVLYVTFVVVATWYWRKRSTRRRQESRARYTFARPEEGSVEEEDDEEGPAARESTALIGDVRDLENAFEDEDEEEPELEAEYANIQNRMSIVRPTLEIRTPSHIHSNIRPSLFGALEVRPLFKPFDRFSFAHCPLNWGLRLRCRGGIDDTPSVARHPVKLLVVSVMSATPLHTFALHPRDKLPGTPHY